MENGLTAKRCARTSIITLFLMCFLGISAHADEFSVLLNGKAIHLDSQPGVHEGERVAESVGFANHD